MFILTVQLPLSGQYAFMESARAKMTTNTKSFKRNLPIPASPPFQMDLLGERANRCFCNNASFRPFWQGLFILADFVEFCNGKSLPTRKAFCFGTECTKVKESMVWYSLYKSELTVWVAAKRSAWLMINNVMTPNRANHLAVAPWLPNSENRRGCQRRALPVHLDRWQCWMALLSLW